MDKRIHQRIQRLEMVKIDPERMTLGEYYSAPSGIQDELFSGWYGEGDIDSQKPHSKKIKKWLKVHRKEKPNG